MANHKSALKRNRQNAKRNERNRGYRTQLKNVTKKVYGAVEEKNTENAQKALHEASRTISRIASKGVIHPRSASRKISGLARRVNTLSATS